MTKIRNSSYEQLWLDELREFTQHSRILQLWEPVAYLARGTFAYVFRVKNRKTGQEAALKFVPNPMDASECGVLGSQEEAYYRSRFEASKREAEIMKRFSGEKNVVQYCEEPEYISRFFLDQNENRVVQHAVLICMPLYQNHQEWMPAIANSREKKIKVGMDIARALVAFEKEGIFHRDIKLGNILMDEEGNFCLGDVGEAKLESDSATRGYHGAKGYMAPEVYRMGHETGTMRWDHSADIYSLGMTLYLLFHHGQFPFLDGEGKLTAEASIRYRQYASRNHIDQSIALPDGECARLLRYSGEELPRPAQADAALSRVILYACAFDQEERCQSA